MVEGGRIKRMRRVCDIYSVNDLLCRVETATAALKADICREFGGEPDDPRLRVLDNTRRLYGCFLLWQGHYIGEIHVSIVKNRIQIQFLAR